MPMKSLTERLILGIVLVVGIVRLELKAQGRDDRPEPGGRRGAGRAFGSGVEGGPALGRGGAGADARQLGRQAPLAVRRGAGHRDRPGSHAGLVRRPVQATRFQHRRPGRARKAFRSAPSTEMHGAPVVLVAGNDARGVLFGVGPAAARVADDARARCRCPRGST